MAHSFTDALVAAGLVSAEETPEARQKQRQRERQEKEAAELAARMGEAAPSARWEPPAAGRIMERPAEEGSEPRGVVCSECGETFDPTSADHKRYGRADQCGPCARGEEPGPRRKRGQMVWTHKTAPTLEIEGGQKLTPEELAAMRRR